MRARRSRSNCLFASLLGFVFFLTIALSSSSISGGDDAYRHVRFANRLITATQDALSDPWRLPHFWPKPLDVWFGYHVLLAPVTLLLPLILAAKFVGAFMWGAIGFVLQELADVLSIRWARAWVILALCGSSIVLYRATLVRPFLLSLLLMLLVTRYVIEERAVAIGVSSFIHALSYSIFFMPALPVVLYLFLRRTRRSVIMTAACLGGLLLGIAANPFFPENVKFSLAQVLTPFEPGSAELLDIGMEVRPINIWWLAVTIPVFAVWLPALVIIIAQFRRRRASIAQVLLLAMSVLLLIGSFRVSRTIDLFVPFAVLFAASVLSPWLDPHREKAQFAFGLLCILAAAGMIPALGTIRSAPSITRFQGASQFLEQAAINQTVLNTHWEQYPFLYFWNWRSRYVTGIDPTFLYRNDTGRYWLWRHLSDDSAATCPEQICTERNTIPVEEAMVTGIRARYAVVEPSKNPKLLAVLRASTKVKEAYQDSNVSVFELLEASAEKQ